MTSLLMSSCQSAFCIDFFDADNQIPEKLQAVFPFATLLPERPRELAHRLLLTELTILLLVQSHSTFT